LYDSIPLTSYLVDLRPPPVGTVCKDAASIAWP
jgi:hypothetical protein